MSDDYKRSNLEIIGIWTLFMAGLYVVAKVLSWIFD